MYDVLGRIVTLTHANGATAGYSYNAAGWVTSLVNAKSSATTITSHAYSYDAVGNPVGMTEANGDVLTWTYDALNQLTREQRSGDNAYDLPYSYDPVGNRLTGRLALARTSLRDSTEVPTGRQWAPPRSCRWPPRAPG